VWEGDNHPIRYLPRAKVDQYLRRHVIAEIFQYRAGPENAQRRNLGFLSIRQRIAAELEIIYEKNGVKDSISLNVGQGTFFRHERPASIIRRHPNTRRNIGVQHCQIQPQTSFGFHQ